MVLGLLYLALGVAVLLYARFRPGLYAALVGLAVLAYAYFRRLTRR